MLKVIKYIGYICSLSFLTACGEFIDPMEMDVIEGLTMSRHKADLMVGDTLILDVSLTPANKTAALRWSVAQGDSSAVNIIGRQVVGKSAGNVCVGVQTSTQVVEDSIIVTKMLSDTCHVRVFDWHTTANNSFPYETMVIAQLQIDNEEVTTQLGERRVAATVAGKFRGKGIVRKDHGITYLLFRIGSYYYGETAIIECYDKQRYECIVVGKITLDGNTHGQLSAPLQLRGQFLP